MGGAPTKQGMFTPAAGFTFGGGGPSGPSGIKIEHRVGIKAPAEVIWEIMADIPGWESWNPVYPKAAGELRIGSRLNLTVAIPGEAHRQIAPVILDWVPNDQIHWKLSMMGGLITSIRYLEIDILGEENCIFSNGELFQGLLSPLVSSKRRAIRQGFTALGEAMQAKAEAAWQARQP